MNPKQCKVMRAMHGWTQATLAATAGLGQSTVADFERGARNSDTDTVAAIVAAFANQSMSYHDLHITTDGLERTSIFNLPYNIKVECTRVAGWQVWHRPDDRGDYQLLCGEYDKPGLILDVAGLVILDSLTYRT